MNATPARVVRLSMLCVLAAALPAHGGSYRGPGGPPTGGPSPNIPGPITPDPGGRPETGGRGDIDLTRWQLWWEFNKDPYLRRLPGQGGSEGAGTPVSLEQKREVILPALCEAIESTTNRDMTSALLIAIAKVGVDRGNLQILPLLRARLRRGDQEIRETAALALGITERVEALPDLEALLQDQPAGRALLGQEKVDDRTRAFAGYALGLIARRGDAEVKAHVFAVLAAVLDDRDENSRDVLVAAINGLRLLDPAPDGSPRDKRLRWQCLDVLDRFAARDLGKARQIVQAHVAPATARLLGRGDGVDRERVKRAHAELLLGSARTQHALPQSAALALGLLAESPDVRPQDEVFSAALRRAVVRATDQQVRCFALIALGQIGGQKNHDALVDVLRREKGPIQTWAALALGLLAHGAPADGSQRDRGVVDGIGRLLARQLDECGNPDARAAFAVALGLARHTPAAPQLREMVKKYHRSEELCGYLCIGLSLMDDQAAAPLLRSILDDARYRPLLMAQAARALARLEQRGAAELLHGMLRREESGTTTLAASATALGSIGDASSVAPLLAMLRDESLPKLLRAFAAASLGMIADDDRLPWNAWIAMDLNYRAMVETLSNGASGVLDIL